MKGRKMKTRTKTLIISILFVSMLIPVCVDAKPSTKKMSRDSKMQRDSGPRSGRQDRQDRQPGRGDGILPALQKLDLTEEQRTQIKTIRDDSKENMKVAREAVMEAQRNLRQAVISDANEAVIRSVASAIGDAIGNEAILKVSVMTQIKTVDKVSLKEIIGSLTKERLAEVYEGMKLVMDIS